MIRIMAAYAHNRSVGRDYEVVEKIEAGIELSGGEVKALRAGRASLDGAHVAIRGGEAYLIGAHIPPYQAHNTDPAYDAERVRRLLLHKGEIVRLARDIRAARLTLVPVMVYNKKNKVKVEVALVRGKKKYDKRESIKRRDSDRDIGRTLKKG